MTNQFEQLGDHVFITYARADGGEFAGQLHDDLEKNGVNTWLDKRDIKPGQNYRLAIDKGLLGARVVIVLLSPVSVLSDEVTAEWNDAINRLVPIIPLMIDDCRIPPNLAIIQYIDFRSDYEKAFAELIDRLKHIEENHLGYLKDRLAELEAAQKKIKDPESLNNRISLLHMAIDYYGRGVRVTDSQTAKKVAVDDEAADSRLSLGQRRIIGQPVSVISHFHDRKGEQTRVQQLLAAPSTRLVSIIGRGGIGKSGLVTKIISDVESGQWEYLEPDAPRPSVGGVIYISTRTRGLSVERIFLDCADLLGGEKQSLIRNLWRSRDLDLESKTSQLLEYFRDSTYVILLDNLEDLQNTDGSLTDEDLYQFLETALNAAHSVKFLTTSRLPLVLSSDLAKLDERIRLNDGLPTNDGIAMLRELDHNGEANFRDEDAATLAKAVDLVHGVPRALEIIFSICQQDSFITLDELIEQFRERPEIENLVADNYKRLDQNSHYILEALSVFARPAPIPALEYMLQPFAVNIPVRQVVDKLARIATVSIDRPTKTINLHPIDRDYVYNALPKTGDYSQQALEIRAADYYEQQRLPAEKWLTIDDLEPQLFEFDHRIRAGQAEIALKLLDSIDNDYLRVWGHLNRLSTMRKQLMPLLSDKTMLYDNTLTLGISYMHRRQNHIAIEYFKEALGIAKALHDEERVGKAHSNLSMAHLAQGELDAAEEHIEPARQIFEKTADQKTFSVILQNQVNIHLYRGRYDEAVETLNIVQKIADEMGDTERQVLAINTQAQLFNHMGKFDHSIELLERYLPLVRSTRNKLSISGMVANLGMAYHSLKQIEKAIVAYQESLEIAQEVGDQQIEATMLTNLGMAYADLGRFTQAEKLQNQALVAARAINHRYIEANIFDNMGLMYQQQKEYDKAIEQFQKGLEIAREIGDAVNAQTFQQHLTETQQMQQPSAQ